MIPPDPAFVTYTEASKILGNCCKRLITEYARKGVLPMPDSYGRFPRAAVEALQAKFEEERRTRAERQKR